LGVDIETRLVCPTVLGYGDHQEAGLNRFRPIALPRPFDRRLMPTLASP
jgi:hypothetical protein